MYGTLPLAEILPEVSKIGAAHIDIWPRKHGNQREQVEAMGHAAFAQLLQAHNIQLGVSTRFDLGPFGLEPEMDFAQKFGTRLLVTGSSGPKGLKGLELRAAVKQFTEQMKPHIATAEEHGVKIAIENHGNALIESPDSMKWMLEFAQSDHFGIALAPYHLPDDAQLVAQLIEDLGSRMFLFYAWQHGMGCMEKLPKEQELLQMPGRGSLDFVPIVASLTTIGFDGFTEIFMHPVPRGIPILDTLPEVTAEINRARHHLETLLKK
ncbi:sugar phosphate isomerase/epimerase [Chloroflexi bacterium TSY]|nr:sugar phosphate isomerase/epimerase [Chloroflexi bacterium TSY]